MIGSGQEASTLFGRRHDTVSLLRPRAVGPYVAQRLEFGVSADDRGSSRLLRLSIENPTSRTFPKMTARKIFNSPSVTAIAGARRSYKSCRSPANRSI
jgi:hypothetical protein